jgi:4-carboxymuconolactone decarboxylase
MRGRSAYTGADLQAGALAFGNAFRRPAMKPLGPTLVSLLLLAIASVDAQRPAAAPQTITITRRGTPAAPAEQPAQAGVAGNMTGSVRVEPVFQAIAPGRTNGSDVTFQPGARTAWHMHPAGQTLIVGAGVGRVQQWGGPVDEIRPGDVVRIPPGVKHWHGASPNDAMTHLAITESVDGRSVEWMEPVSDSQYRAPARARQSAAVRPPRPAGDSTVPSLAPRAMTEFAPQMAELTNRVLYGEVWPSAGLSQRDRSMVTVSALIALNRPEQLRSHLGRARANGVTKEEMAALITHLAFYAGWPSAVNAVTIANEVYERR